VSKNTVISLPSENKSQSSYVSWRNLYRVGAIAAILSAVIFRRNLGAEATLLVAQSPPTTASGWFALLNDNTLLGLVFLNIFDIFDYILVGLMFLSLYIVLKETHRGFMAIALCLSLVGILVYVFSNTAFTMLSLSSKYAVATTGAQRSALLTAGQAVLAEGNPGATYQGTGGLTSLLLLAIAGLMTSVIMLRSRIFNRATACVGILAGVFDFIYIFGSGFVPETDFLIFSSSLEGSAGLLLFLWHFLIGIKLYKLENAKRLRR
jgi:hypothetical protein